MKIPKYGFAVLFGLVLLLFTGYLLADTFLIRRVYATAAEESGAQAVSIQTAEETDTIAIVTEESEAAEEPISNEPVTTDTTYSDENISVTLTTYRLLETTIYVADVEIASPEYLKTALAENSYGRNITEKTSTMAASVNAILAVNGDYYGAQRSGYVIRNGVLYRNTSGGGEDLVIYADGTFGIVNAVFGKPFCGTVTFTSNVCHLLGQRHIGPSTVAEGFVLHGYSMYLETISLIC